MKACACPGFSHLRMKARVAVATVIVTSIRKMWKVDTYMKTNIPASFTLLPLGVKWLGHNINSSNHTIALFPGSPHVQMSNQKAQEAGWDLGMRLYCLASHTLCKMRVCSHCD